jgi:hypothetical protein
MVILIEMRITTRDRNTIVTATAMKITGLTETKTGIAGRTAISLKELEIISAIHGMILPEETMKGPVVKSTAEKTGTEKAGIMTGIIKTGNMDRINLVIMTTDKSMNRVTGSRGKIMAVPRTIAAGKTTMNQAQTGIASAITKTFAMKTMPAGIANKETLMAAGTMRTWNFNFLKPIKRKSPGNARAFSLSAQAETN